MVQNLKILNGKEIKHIHELLEQQYGYKERLDVVFMLSEKKERVYLFTRDFADFEMGRIRVDSMGLYFGTFFEGKLRLTIEGSQLVGNSCTKNILLLNKKEMQVWLQGEKLLLSQLETPADVEPGAFIIMKHGEDFLGCGKIGGDVILNYVPKTRYIHALYDDIPDADLDDVPNAPGEDLPPSI